MDAYSYPWDTSGVSPLMYLDQIMKGRIRRFPTSTPALGRIETDDDVAGTYEAVDEW